jgi:hypothetical protein
MHASTVWVLIPLAAIFTGVIKRWLNIKERQMEAVGREATERAERYARQTDRLEERVRVLERIVTARGTEVAEQIEQLRDRPRIGEERA